MVGRAMFERLMAQAERLGAVRRERFVERLVVRIAEGLPEGVAVAAEDAGLVLTGSCLLRRWVSDVRFRCIGMMAKGADWKCAVEVESVQERVGHGGRRTTK